MKKLHRSKGTVHPSPTPTVSDHLSFLPAAILTLTLSLSPQDREVLAYLISCSSNFSGNPRRNPKILLHGDHPPLFNCTCFRCYMSFWVRWNSSPNHLLIHQILDSFEDSFAQTAIPPRKDKRNKRGSKTNPPHSTLSHSPSENPPVTSTAAGAAEPLVCQTSDGGEDEDKSSVRKFVTFIGERIWGAWGQ